MPHSINITPSMVGQSPKTTINSAKTSKNSAKSSNTLSIAANVLDTPQIAWKFKPEDNYTKDFDCSCWMLGNQITLLQDTLRSVGYKYDLNNIQLLRIILRLLTGKGFKFKVGEKIYAIDPYLVNRLRDYYYKLKAENPAKLNKRIKVSELNTLIHITQ